MKKIFTSVFTASLVWSTLLSHTHVPINNSVTFSKSLLQKNGISFAATQEEIATFVVHYKKELALLAVAITIGLSLKYCPWMQGLVGIDTEAEIDDWRVYIQEN
ncbi:MAG: hypothetical protein AB7F19_01680 [Candidatus Babeliales bacterium]